MMAAGLISFYFPLREADQSELLLTPQDSPKNHIVDVVVFFVLQILGGHLGIPLILITIALSKNVQRHPMLINFLITWVIYSTSFCLLLYVGRQFGPEPPDALCLIQAATIYGTAVMTSAAGLCFVLNLWFNLRKTMASGSRTLKNHSTTLIVAPHILFTLFTIALAVFGSTNGNLVTRGRYVFYCTINSGIVDIVPGCTAFIMLTVVVFEVLIGIKLYCVHKSFTLIRTQSGLPLHLLIRVTVFSVYSFLSIVACISFWSDSGKELPYIIQASLPTAAFVIFGTQRDLLEVWGILGFWRWITQKSKFVLVTKRSEHKVEPIATVR